jgi:hypothetical protein
VNDPFFDGFIVGYFVGVLFMAWSVSLTRRNR